MSEMVDDILEGVFCQHCGVYLGDEVGYPRSCDSCAKEYDEEGTDND